MKKNPVQPALFNLWLISDMLSPCYIMWCVATARRCTKYSRIFGPGAGLQKFKKYQKYDREVSYVLADFSRCLGEPLLWTSA